MTYVTWGFDDLDLPGKAAPARRNSTLLVATAITVGLGGATAILNLASSSATWMAVAYITAGQQDAFKPKHTTLGLLSPRGQAFALPGEGVIQPTRPVEPAPAPQAAQPPVVAALSPAAQPMPAALTPQPQAVESQATETPASTQAVTPTVAPPLVAAPVPPDIPRVFTQVPEPPVKAVALAPVPVTIVLPEPVRRTSIRKPEDTSEEAPLPEPATPLKPIVVAPPKPNPLVAALPPKSEVAPPPLRPGPVAGNGAAVYDIEARTVYLPNGERLEAHSGLGEHMDDPRSAPLKMRGVTPPNTYKLSMRESLFHGVAAIRLTPIGDSPMYNRDGLLAHTFMLGGNGASNGCISFRDYNRFLAAFQRGEINKIVVVARHGGAAPSGVGRFFASVAQVFTPGERDTNR